MSLNRPTGWLRFTLACCCRCHSLYAGACHVRRRNENEQCKGVYSYVQDVVCKLAGSCN